MKRRFAAVVLLVATTPLSAQWLTLSTPGIPRTADGEPDLSAAAPRTADGRPDLTGLWVPSRVSGDLFDDTKVHEWARELVAERDRRFWEDNPRFLCLPTGPAYITAGSTAGGMRRIVQSSTVIAILHSDLNYRQIFVDGRELEPDPLPTWMGYSVGRWDGDTLLVESNGYNDKTWLHRRGLPHTERLRIIERYHRSDFGHLQIDVTYEDPGVADSPLNALVEFEFAADDELLESVCNESSQGRSHWGGRLSDAEAATVDIAPQLLADYVGTYIGSWLGRPVTIEITLDDGMLLMQRTGAENELRNGSDRLRLFPRSETAFDCSCGWGYSFTRGRAGIVNELVEIHVSGEWTFERVD